MKSIQSNRLYLRQWQKDALPGYLKRLDKHQVELTAAYQGQPSA